MDRDTAQALFDEEFPNGATVKLSDDYVLYVPRVMVEEASESKLGLMLWSVEELDPPLTLTVPEPSQFAAPLTLEPLDEDVDKVEFLDSFPDELRPAREEMLRSAWFKTEQEMADADFPDA